MGVSLKVYFILRQLSCAFYFLPAQRNSFLWPCPSAIVPLYLRPKISRINRPRTETSEVESQISLPSFKLSMSIVFGLQLTGCFWLQVWSLTPGRFSWKGTWTVYAKQPRKDYGALVAGMNGDGRSQCQAKSNKPFLCLVFFLRTSLFEKCVIKAIHSVSTSPPVSCRPSSSTLPVELFRWPRTALLGSWAPTPPTHHVREAWS